MSEIKPALTAEQWAQVEGPSGSAEHIRHGIAAMALHGQPFGFTWDDVDLLRRCVVDTELSEHDVVAASVDDPLHAHLSAIADRIAALLPPREGS